MGAVIDAVDAGHYQRSPEDLCRECAEPFPCPAVLAARDTDARARRHPHKETT